MNTSPDEDDDETSLYEEPSKRYRRSDHQQSDFPISESRVSSVCTNLSTPLSDSGETVQENTVSYVSRAKDNRNGTDIVRHVMAHEKISNNKNKHMNANTPSSTSAPFATDFNNDTFTPIPTLRPVLPPSSWQAGSQQAVAQAGRHIAEVVEDDIYDTPPPPGTIVLSNAIKKKVALVDQFSTRFCRLTFNFFLLTSCL